MTPGRLLPRSCCRGRFAGSDFDRSWFAASFASLALATLFGCCCAKRPNFSAPAVLSGNPLPARIAVNSSMSVGIAHQSAGCEIVV